MTPEFSQQALIAVCVALAAVVAAVWREASRMFREMPKAIAALANAMAAHESADVARHLEAAQTVRLSGDSVVDRVGTKLEGVRRELGDDVLDVRRDIRVLGGLPGDTPVDGSPMKPPPHGPKR